MPKTFSPAVMTANDLLEGDAVWWTGAAWSRDLAAAQVAETPDAVEALSAFASSAALEAQVVGPYLVDVTLASGAPFPTVRREAIRADREPTFAYAPEPLEKAA
ncbi:MAG: DUF2849 domain-containing protein [Pseudomonadota bacterium]